jgi:hypothetical protein
MDLITATRLSMRAFVCGLLAILPVIGLVPAVYAVRCWLRVRLRYGDGWNPAAQYLHWGTFLAVFGGLLSALGLIVAVMVAQLAAIS